MGEALATLYGRNDRASAHAGLRAYVRYLSAVVTDFPAARQQADGFVTSVAMTFGFVDPMSR
jgi:hypothetical protein